MATIAELVYWVELKNEINRRRRRFYSIMTGGKPKEGLDVFNHAKRVVSEVDAKQGREGYEKAKAEMKQLTPTITKLKRELLAELSWNGGGMIVAIHLLGGVRNEYTNTKCWRDSCVRCIHHNNFKRLATDHAFERAALR